MDAQFRPLLKGNNVFLRIKRWGKYLELWHSNSSLDGGENDEMKHNIVRTMVINHGRFNPYPTKVENMVSC